MTRPSWTLWFTYRSPSGRYVMKRRLWSVRNWFDGKRLD